MTNSTPVTREQIEATLKYWADMLPDANEDVKTATRRLEEAKRAQEQIKRQIDTWNKTLILLNDAGV